MTLVWILNFEIVKWVDLNNGWVDLKGLKRTEKKKFRPQLSQNLPNSYCKGENNQICLVSFVFNTIVTHFFQ